MTSRVTRSGWLVCALVAATFSLSAQAEGVFDKARAVAVFAGMSKETINAKLAEANDIVARAPKTYQRCGNEADALDKAQAPEGFNSLDSIIRAQLVRPNDPTFRDLPKPVVRPEYQKHAEFIRTRRNALGECGNTLAPLAARLPAALQLNHDMLMLLNESQRSMAAPVLSNLQKFDQSSEFFVRAVNRLSHNPDASSYVSDVIAHLVGVTVSPAHFRR